MSKTNAPIAPDVYSAAHFALEIDGQKQLTNLRSVEGGAMKADVVKYEFGEGGQQYRQLGKYKIDDIKLTFGLAANPDVWKWMSTFLSGKPERRNGSILAADYTYTAKARRDFTDGLIASIDFPKWDANDKNPANVTLTIAVENIKYAPASGHVDAKDQSEADQKGIKAANFQFRLDGFEDACKRVPKVDAFSIKMKVIEHHVSTRLEPVKVPGKIEWPNLVFYVPEVDANLFRSYLDDKIGKGKAQATGFASAHLEFYGNEGPDKIHGSFTFNNVHPFAISPEKHDAGSEDTKLVKVECAVESIDFTLNG